MSLLPRATKLKLARLVKSKGYVIPSVYNASFVKNGHSFWLKWTGKDGTVYRAYYSAVAGRPFLSVNDKSYDLTMAEVIHFDLVQEKYRFPDISGRCPDSGPAGRIRRKNA